MRCSIVLNSLKDIKIKITMKRKYFLYCLILPCMIIFMQASNNFVFAQECYDVSDSGGASVYTSKAAGTVCGDSGEGRCNTGGVCCSPGQFPSDSGCYEVVRDTSCQLTVNYLSGSCRYDIGGGANLDGNCLLGVCVRRNVCVSESRGVNGSLIYTSIPGGNCDVLDEGTLTAGECGGSGYCLLPEPEV